MLLRQFRLHLALFSLSLTLSLSHTLSPSVPFPITHSFIIPTHSVPTYLAS
ncbi:hypothetical protein ACSS6W_000280 [Trichoderma asperelloides]